MSAAIALILLVKAASACASGGMRPLPGGAVVVRPVTTLDAPPFERLGPATSIRNKAEGVQRTGASSGAQRAQGEQPTPQQCEAAITTIA